MIKRQMIEEHSQSPSERLNSCFHPALDIGRKTRGAKLDVRKMDKEGYRKYLTDREQPIPEDEIIETTRMVEKFEEYLKQFGKTLDTAAAPEVRKFTKSLIGEGRNTYTSYVALTRYGYFIKNMNLFLAVLELLDGAEVMNVLHERLGEHVGEAKRDKTLPEHELPPLGLPSSEKVNVTRQVLKKMNRVLTPDECKKVLVDVARTASGFQEGKTRGISESR